MDSVRKCPIPRMNHNTANLRFVNNIGGNQQRDIQTSEYAIRTEIPLERDESSSSDHLVCNAQFLQQTDGAAVQAKRAK